MSWRGTARRAVKARRAAAKSYRCRLKALQGPGRARARGPPGARCPGMCPAPDLTLDRVADAHATRGRAGPRRARSCGCRSARCALTPHLTGLLTRARPGARRTAAREELRLQVGTLRFDLNALAEGKDKASRKKALGLKADFLKKARPPARRRRFPCAWETLATRRSPLRACRRGRAGHARFAAVWGAQSTGTTGQGLDERGRRRPRRRTSWTTRCA